MSSQTIDKQVNEGYQPLNKGYQAMTISDSTNIVPPKGGSGESQSNNTKTDTQKSN